MSDKLHERLYKIYNWYWWVITDEDKDFVQQQWGIVTKHIKDTINKNSVVYKDGVFYDYKWDENKVFCSEELLDTFKFMFDGEMIRQLTSRQYETLFLPF